MVTPYDNQIPILANQIGFPITTFIVLLIVVGIWSLIWKGFALWKAAKKNSLAWFIVLLILNTIGILEILYIFVFSKMNKRKVSNKKKR